jgi:hypothetical protein
MSLALNYKCILDAIVWLVGAEIIISSEHIRNKTKPKSTN